MKKLYKFITIFSICALTFASSCVSSSASAADTWAGFQDVTIGLSFTKMGKAVYYTSVIPSKDSYYSKISMKLQQYSGGSWHTLTSGTHGDTSIHAYSSTRYVTNGTYRVYSTVTIYKSKGGKKINSDTFIYKNKY